jgi:putative ABC transport system substrate-binding protein
MMKRREFIALLTGTAIPWPLRANAKTGLPRVGVLQAGTVDSSEHLTDVFTQGLNVLGYVEGKNILIERRYAQGQLDRLFALAAELASLNVDLILAATGSAALAAQNASKTIPIVFALVTDPVGEGFVFSLARPGGRLTGLTNIAVDLAAKRLQTLQEAVPNLSRIGVLYFQAYPGVALQLDELQRAAKALGKSLLPVEVKRPEEIPAAFEKMMQWQANAAAVIESPMFFTNRERIVALAASSKLPTIYNAREYVRSGGLLSYGASYPDLYRRAATYVDKILQGASPADLPVEAPTKFELVLNVNTAKALGLTIPVPLQIAADELIE